MSNESYVNHYIELMTSTMTDCIIRNVSLQANAKVTEEVLLEMQQKIANSQDDLKPLYEKIEQLEKIRVKFEDMRSDYDNVKHQVNHIDTFRNELVRERESHQQTREMYEKKVRDLENKIEFLQLTPGKRKKIEESQKVVVSPVEEPTNQFDSEEHITKDGGSF